MSDELTMKNKILELRKETGFTQGVLARKYISRQTINTLEND